MFILDFVSVYTSRQLLVLRCAEGSQDVRIITVWGRGFARGQSSSLQVPVCAAAAGNRLLQNKGR